MGQKVELERKFLVVDGAWPQSSEPSRIEQGYLQRSEELTVRVRLEGDRAFLTIKGRTRGHARDEYEYAIPPSDARSLLELCTGQVIRKQRHRVPYGGLVWEIDVFEAENAGLVVAEIEAPTEEALDEAVRRKPPWVLREVTANTNLYNARLSQRPFSQWSAEERDALVSG